MQNQPPWSDAPVIMLTKARSSSSRSSRLMAEMREPLGHTTLLERPLRPEILVSTVETVLRARRRQFQIRDAVEQLQASEARYRSLILASSSIVWTTNLYGDVVEPLPSWEAYTGQSFAEYSGSGWANAIHPADRERVIPVVTAAILGLRPYQVEFRLRRHDGQYRSVVSRSVPVFREDSSVKEWVGTCIDIQDRKDSEAALRKSERLALAGQLAASIAHEINNPLEAVTNLLYLISTRVTDDESRHYCSMAQRELTRVTEISGQTLASIARPRSQPKPMFRNCSNHCCTCSTPSSGSAIFRCKPSCTKRRRFWRFLMNCASCLPTSSAMPSMPRHRAGESASGPALLATGTMNRNAVFV